MTKYMKSMHKVLNRPIVKMDSGGPYPQPSGQDNRDLRTKYPWLPQLNNPDIISSGPSKVPLNLGANVQMPGASAAIDAPGLGIKLNNLQGINSTPASSGTSQQGSNVLNNLVPFASNIVNSFRKPPMPTQPTSNPLVTLNKVNYDNERNSVSREINAANTDAERNVSGNSAQAIKLYNLGNKLNAFSTIAEKESNQNTQIGNYQSMMNSQIQAGNNAKRDDFNTSLTERQLAQQREQSSNLSNFSDKYIGMQNEKEKARVDLDKTKVLSSPYMRSGVYQAQAKQWKAQGVPDPLGRNYDYLDDKRPDVFGNKKDSKATGGIMKFRSMVKC